MATATSLAGPPQVSERDKPRARHGGLDAVPWHRRRIVCGIDVDWPNLDAALPVLGRAVDAFATEQSVFAATIALLRATQNRLFPVPGLGWILCVARARRAEPGFWTYASNGERLVLLLRDLIASGPPAPVDREIFVEVADTLIELGVNGAAVLQQDLVRQKR